MEPITFAERLRARIAFRKDQHVRLRHSKPALITDPELRQMWYTFTIYRHRSKKADKRARHFTDKKQDAALAGQPDLAKQYNRYRLINEYEHKLYEDLSIQFSIKSNPAGPHKTQEDDRKEIQSTLKLLEKALENVGLDPDELRQRILG